MRLTRISFLFFLALGAANAYAEPGGLVRDARRDAIRAYHIQAVNMDRNLPRDPVPVQPPQDARRPGISVPESSGYGSSGDSQSNSTQQAENMRRQGRMTPEERRALRRQIDEAGHDIYTPKR
ncbi:MAG TPA: hypothetical protein VEC01_12820 [Noviherbaspirillum sp.]|uniref:hypothetical protein n=1 Tax=Noviherbaspirillum sp. TaxID=1926288 RepID=UPI002D673B85|nr:hypothetical protein [Noviherbaspirillum sp.]HYD96203.1 hypothetical protein [Noviherbaspirillum sp.]